MISWKGKLKKRRRGRGSQLEIGEGGGIGRLSRIYLTAGWPLSLQALSSLWEAKEARGGTSNTTGGARREGRRWGAAFQERSSSPVPLRRRLGFPPGADYSTRSQRNLPPGEEEEEKADSQSSPVILRFSSFSKPSLLKEGYFGWLTQQMFREAKEEAGLHFTHLSPVPYRWKLSKENFQASPGEIWKFFNLASFSQILSHQILKKYLDFPQTTLCVDKQIILFSDYNLLSWNEALSRVETLCSAGSIYCAVNRG